MEQTSFLRKSSIQLNGELIDLSKPLVMGILNLTPDSFFDGGQFNKETQAIEKVGKMLDEGATFIDVGAVSSRPGATLPSVDEELKRLMPTLQRLRKEFPQIRLSVDTFRSEVVREVVAEVGSVLVNDISAGQYDEKMFATVAELGLPYCMMHIKGTPQTMQQNPVYENLVQEMVKFFASRIEKLKLLGAKDIILDPGFGFAKTLDHNYELLSKLDYFKVFELPLLVGVSRKSMIYKLLDTTPDKALNGTSVIHTHALCQGANILRIHDVVEAMECIKISEKLKQNSLGSA